MALNMSGDIAMMSIRTGGNQARQGRTLAQPKSLTFALQQLTGSFNQWLTLMSATLRIVEPADYEVIASWVPDAESCLRWAGPRVVFLFTAADLPGLLAVSAGRSYCLTERTAIPLGFGQHWVLRPGAVHLGRIIIAPAVRGRGFGRLLCQLLLAQAIEATGAAEVTLRVDRNNTVALSLYSRLGFSAVEAESSQRALFMRREANPGSGAATSRRSP
jgi:ribosomal protein S18 acetylase RimI-like enzyme